MLGRDRTSLGCPGRSWRIDSCASMRRPCSSNSTFTNRMKRSRSEMHTHHAELYLKYTGPTKIFLSEWLSLWHEQLHIHHLIQSLIKVSRPGARMRRKIIIFLQYNEILCTLKNQSGVLVRLREWLKHFLIKHLRKVDGPHEGPELKRVGLTIKLLFISRAAGL